MMLAPADATSGARDSARLSPSGYARLARIVAGLARAGLGGHLQRMRIAGADDAQALALDEHDSAVRVREALESLGPTFVKFGQLLSVRRDILPDAYIDELTRLQDRVPPDPEAASMRVIEAELGQPPEQAFAAFDRQPFAAASMAQVYDARLSDDTQVVVKVQRAGIQATVHDDLHVLFFLARQLERHVPASRRFSPVELGAEFAETIRAELDFRREGHNADRFRENFASEPAVWVPGIFWDLTTARVLTMERSMGRRASEYGTAHPETGRPLAAKLVRLFLTQVFEHRFFHADPHPGNVFVLDDGRLCFHDFGIVGTLGAADHENLSQLVLAVVTRDPEWVADAFFSMGVARENVDRAAFTRDLDEALAAFYGKRGAGTMFSEILNQFIHIGQRHSIRLPRAFLRVAKSFMAIEAQTIELDPGFDMLAALREFAPRLMQQLLAPPLDGAGRLRTGYRALRAIRLTATALPDVVRGLTDTLRDPKVRVDLPSEQIRGLEERIERASNRLSFSLIIASLVVGSAIIVSFHAGPHYQGVPLLGLVGFVVAVLMGLRWAFAVLRGGRL